jgi:benzaldehyde dehydrogenase (NAD)
VGDVATEQVALGPVIDERSRDKIHGLVTARVDQGARLPAGGEYDRLFYRPTEFPEVPLTSPVFTEEVFGPVAPVTRVTRSRKRYGWPRKATTGCRWASSLAT